MRRRLAHAGDVELGLGLRGMTDVLNYLATGAPRLHGQTWEDTMTDPQTILEGIIAIVPDDTRNTLDAVAADLVNGLVIDGAHHKQHFMEEALRRIVGDDRFEFLADAYGWDEGVPS